jgi:ribosome-binding protein aMBF1 (putative translation factor)
MCSECAEWAQNAQVKSAASAHTGCGVCVQWAQNHDSWLEISSERLWYGPMTWGKRIADARRAAGMTQEDLAERMNASQQAVASWEAQVNEPRLAIFEAIAKITGTSPEWLAFGVGDGPR